MALLTIQTERSTDYTNIVYANRTIANKIKLPLDMPFKITFGNKTTEFNLLSVSSNKSNLFRVSNQTAKELLLPDGILLNGIYNDNELKLGPILGILIQNIHANQPKNPFGKFTAFASELSQKAFTKGVVPCFFTIKDINTEEDTVKCWVVSGNKWEQKQLPIPNVIYNRISSRGYEKKIIPQINELKKKYKFIFFNDYFLNKWDVSQLLKPTALRTIIPKTVMYKGINSIREMLNQYRVIYVKPTNGSLGRGIIRIEKKEAYEVKHSRAQGQNTITFPTIGKMFSYLVPRMKSQPYIVQQGLDLISQGTRPIDFRILVQKNGFGDWSITSIVARTANDHHFVSNIAQGGTQGTMYETIKSASPDLVKKIKRKDFTSNALSIAKNIESLTKGNFAELGIDLALEKNGKIWLLEVNSKPSKTDELRENMKTRPSVVKLINYVLFISRMKEKKISNQR